MTSSASGISCINDQTMSDVVTTSTSSSKRKAGISTDSCSTSSRNINRSRTFDEYDDKYDYYYSVDGKRNKRSTSVAVLNIMKPLDEDEQYKDDGCLSDCSNHSTSSIPKQDNSTKRDDELLLFTPPSASQYLYQQQEEEEENEDDKYSNSQSWTRYNAIGASKPCWINKRTRVKYFLDDSAPDVPVPCLKMRVDNNENGGKQDLGNEVEDFVHTSGRIESISSGQTKQQMVFRLEPRQRRFSDATAELWNFNANSSSSNSFTSLPNLYLSPNSVVPQTPTTSTPPLRLTMMMKMNRKDIESDDLLCPPIEQYQPSTIFMDPTLGLPPSLSLPKLPGLVVSAMEQRSSNTSTHTGGKPTTIHIQMRPQHYHYNHDNSLNTIL